LYETASSPGPSCVGTCGGDADGGPSRNAIWVLIRFRPITAPLPTIAIEDTTRIIAAIHSTDLTGLTITTGIDVHIDITVTIIAKTL
jgi:hypothetical protein